MNTSNPKSANSYVMSYQQFESLKRWLQAQSVTSDEPPDFELRCGDNIFNVHKSVISERSDVFAKLCDGHFKEAKDGFAVLDEDDPEVLSAVIEYMYIGTGVKFQRRIQRQNSSGPDDSRKSDSVAKDDGIPHEANDLKNDDKKTESLVQRTRRLAFSEHDNIDSVSGSSDQKQTVDEKLPPYIFIVVSGQLKNIGVYSAAGKYLLPQLQTSALTNFKILPFATWKTGISDILYAVSESTHSSDDRLRSYFVDVCAREMALNDDAEYEKALEALPDLHVEILKKISFYQAKKISGLEIQLSDARRTIDKLSKANDRLKQEDTDAGRCKGMKAVAHRVNSLPKRCRHCSTELNVRIDPLNSYNPAQKIVVRCKECTTKH